MLSDPLFPRSITSKRLNSKSPWLNTSRIEPFSPPRTFLHDLGDLSEKLTALLISVEKVKGFVIAELDLMPTKAPARDAAVNGMTGIPVSLYEICSALMVTIPFMGFVIL